MKLSVLYFVLVLCSLPLRSEGRRLVESDAAVTSETIYVGGEQVRLVVQDDWFRKQWIKVRAPKFDWDDSSTFNWDDPGQPLLQWPGAAGREDSVVLKWGDRRLPVSPEVYARIGLTIGQGIRHTGMGHWIEVAGSEDGNWVLIEFSVPSDSGDNLNCNWAVHKSGTQELIFRSGVPYGWLGLKTDPTLRVTQRQSATGQLFSANNGTTEIIELIWENGLKHQLKTADLKITRSPDLWVSTGTSQTVCITMDWMPRDGEDSPYVYWIAFSNGEVVRFIPPEARRSSGGTGK